MLVALADSLFLSIDPERGAQPGAAVPRHQLRPVPGHRPADRPGHRPRRRRPAHRHPARRRGAGRAGRADGGVDRQLALFPLVFAALVLQKTYLVSKQALVPSVVRTEAELVEANSKLGVIAGLTGFVAVIPAAILQLTPIKGWGTLLYSGAAVRLRPGQRHPAAGRRRRRPAGAAGRAGPAALGRRCSWRRWRCCCCGPASGSCSSSSPSGCATQSAGTAWFARRRRAVGARRRWPATPSPRACAGAVREETMLAGALGLSAVAGVARRAPRRRRRRRRAGRRRQLRRRRRPARLREHRPARCARRPTAAGPSPGSRPASSSRGPSPG